MNIQFFSISVIKRSRGRYIIENNYMFTRNCPTCSKEICYSNKQSFKNSISKNSDCKSCSVKKQYEKNPEKNKGDENGMFKNSLKIAMNNKYGKKIADLKYSEWKNKKNKFKPGKSNPQFGKSPFKGGGRSYQGWYKGIYFRSTFELIFMVENQNLDLISAEKTEFRVEYTNLDLKRYYYPDFYSEKSNTVYEIKSNQWAEDPLNKNKFEFARNHFKEKNMEYSIITEKNLKYLKDAIGSKYKIGKLVLDFIYDKFINNEIKLTPSSIKRMEKKLFKN